MDHDLDTSTAEGFSEGLNRLGISITRLALVLRSSESSIKSWLRGVKPVHPTAAEMMNWLLAGYRPLDWHMTGGDLARAREKLGLDQDQLGELLWVETDTIIAWESDFDGPPMFVAQAVSWLGSAKPPKVLGEAFR